jgi:glutaredoxin/chromate transport protein ChrA
VVFHSPVTDLDGLPEELERQGYRCSTRELGMGNPDNRALFDRLREETGHRTLPQVFIDGRFVGGLGESRAWLRANVESGPRGALLLGYAGLIPFLAGAVLIAVGEHDFGATLLAGYAAVILSFVGAVHWGLALGQGERRWRHYGTSVVPALIAWAALLLPPTPSLGVLAAGLAGWRLWEYLADVPAFPQWFARLRDHLTFGASALVMIGALLLAIPVAPR